MFSLVLGRILCIVYRAQGFARAVWAVGCGLWGNQVSGVAYRVWGIGHRAQGFARAVWGVGCGLWGNQVSGVAYRRGARGLGFRV